MGFLSPRSHFDCHSGIFGRHMIQYLLSNAFKLFVRLAVLMAACLTMGKILTDELGYRMDFNVMLVAAAMMIITVRVWMPWHKDS